MKIAQRFLLACVAMMLCAPLIAQTPSRSSNAPAATPAAALDARIRAEIAKFKGTVSLCAKNLDTGATYALNADAPVRTASTIKTPIMVGVFALVAEGKVKWTDELVLTEAKKQKGSGVLMELGDSTKLTLRDAVHLMIVVSDNTATNLVLDHVTADAVNAKLAALGFKVTRSLRKIGGGGESKAFNDPANKRPDGSGYGIGVTTPREMVTLFEKLERGELVSPEASKEMLAILKRQQYREGIGRNLLGVDLANKTGALDALRSDTGILYSPRGRIAIAITCDDMPEVAWTVDNPALLLISRLSEMLVEGLGREPEKPPEKPRDKVSRGASAAKEFEIAEGIFHDGLGTFAELSLANALLAGSKQPLFDLSRSEAKMNAALARLAATDPRRAKLERERASIATATEHGAALLRERARPATVAAVRHTAREFTQARAADLVLELSDGRRLPVSVKTEKSNKLAVAEGQTPEIETKWAARYFRIAPDEFTALVRELGFASLDELKADYRNIARLVAHVLMRKLELTDCQPDDFSRARVGNLEAARFLFQQLLAFKHGKDDCAVIIFDRASGAVAWASRLDAINLDGLTAERISFRPSRPRNGHPVATEFGIKLDGQVVVTFQVKHKRGAQRGTARQYEFSDITTRLII